jgi:hypothetical protein
VNAGAPDKQLQIRKHPLFPDTFNLQGDSFTMQDSHGQRRGSIGEAD